VIVRAEREGDEADIGRIAEAAFGGVAEANLVDALRAAGQAAISLVAEEAGAMVGHVMFSPLRDPESCLALAPLCVRPDRQRRGIGSRLVRDGLERARDEGWRAVFVLGEPAYYERFGFRPGTAAAFKTPYPPAFLMALELTPGALAGEAGAVVYPPPFAALA